MATQTRAPTSDNSKAGTIAYSSGTTGYNLVNDYPDTADPLTSYVTLGTTANSAILFNFTAFSIPTGSTGISVAVQYTDEEPSAGTNSSDARIIVGGTGYSSGTTHNPSVTTTARSKTFANNPKTSAAWTAAQINGTDATNPLQAFGVIGPDSNPVWRIGSIQCVVTYTPPPQTFAPDLATGTGAAYDPTTAATGDAAFEPAAATGSGASYDPSISASGDAPFSVGVATGAGSAYDGTIEIVASAQDFSTDTATGTGEAYNGTLAGTGAITFDVSAASGSGAAYDATTAASGAAGFAPATATGSGEAYDSAIFASGAVVFSVDAASGEGAANDATITATGDALFAPDQSTGTGEAHDPDIVASGYAPFAPDTASGTGSAHNPTFAGGYLPAISFEPDTATGTGEAHDATISLPEAPSDGNAGGWAVWRNTTKAKKPKPRGLITIVLGVASGNGQAHSPTFALSGTTALERQIEEEDQAILLWIEMNR